MIWMENDYYKSENYSGFLYEIILDFYIFDFYMIVPAVNAISANFSMY